jgi:1,4-dihydroxy-2-naphthoate octaprenyltransferase
MVAPVLFSDSSESSGSSDRSGCGSSSSSLLHEATFMLSPSIIAAISIQLITSRHQLFFIILYWLVSHVAAKIQKSRQKTIIFLIQKTLLLQKFTAYTHVVC